MAKLVTSKLLRCVLASLFLAVVGVAPGVGAASSTHNSRCHVRHSCPSDDRSYVWTDGAGQGWLCSIESPYAKYGVARGSTSILWSTTTYVNTYACDLVDSGLAPPEEPLSVVPGRWTRYVTVETARKMAKEMDRHTLPTDGLQAIYLPSWLPSAYTLTGWKRWIDADGPQTPTASLVLYMTHRSGAGDANPSWDVSHLDPELGGCAGNHIEIPHRLKLADRTILYGNVAYSGGVSKGAAAVCFQNGVQAEFNVDIPLPVEWLKRIALSAAKATG
jgi:hypothetical protein